MDSQNFEAWFKHSSIWTPTYYYGTLTINSVSAVMAGHAPAIEHKDHEIFNIPLCDVSEAVIYPGTLTIKTKDKKFPLYLYNPIAGIGQTSKGYGVTERVHKRQPGLEDIGDPSPKHAIPKIEMLARMLTNSGVRVNNKTDSRFRQWSVNNTEQNLKAMRFFDMPSTKKAWRVAIIVLLGLILILIGFSIVAVTSKK
jgi:hypothetical protein